MSLYSLINQIIHLAEARGERDILSLVLELEREMTKILAKLIELRMAIDDVVGEYVQLDKTQLTKVELDIVDMLKEQNCRCVDVNTIIRKLEGYTPITVITALKRLKIMKIVDIDVDVDQNGKLSVRACLRVK